MVISIGYKVNSEKDWVVEANTPIKTGKGKEENIKIEYFL